MSEDFDLLDENSVKELEQKITKLNEDRDFLVNTSEIINLDAEADVKLKKFQDLLVSKKIVLDSHDVAVYFDAINTTYTNTRELQSRELEEVAAGAGQSYTEDEQIAMYEKSARSKAKAVIAALVVGGLALGTAIAAPVAWAVKKKQIKKAEKEAFEAGKAKGKAQRHSDELFNAQMSFYNRGRI